MHIVGQESSVLVIFFVRVGHFQLSCGPGLRVGASTEGFPVGGFQMRGIVLYIQCAQFDLCPTTPQGLNRVRNECGLAT